jgi:hypothetical protein
MAGILYFKLRSRIIGRCATVMTHYDEAGVLFASGRVDAVLNVSCFAHLGRYKLDPQANRCRFE